jgi:hypothetical protein
MPTVTVQLTDDLYRQLQLETQRTGTDLNALITRAIETALEEPHAARMTAAESEDGPLRVLRDEVAQIRAVLDDLPAAPIPLVTARDDFSAEMSPEEWDDALRSLPPLDPAVSRAMNDMPVEE